MRIEDGKGKNGAASVSAVQRLNVSAKMQDRIFYVSRDDGRAFNAVYDEVTAVAAGQYTMYLKNTSSTRNLYVSTIEFHSVENVKWKIWSVSGTAAGGTVETPADLNLGAGFDAEVIAMSGPGITGLTTVSQLGTHRSQALGDSEMDFHGALILGPGDAIAVEYDSGTTGSCSHDCFFWFETIGAT